MCVFVLWTSCLRAKIRYYCMWPFAKKLYHGWISTMTSSNEISWKFPPRNEELVAPLTTWFIIFPFSCFSGVRRKFSWGGFIQWHMVVICIWCDLFVTSQFDVIFMFSSEVCWHNRHFSYTHSPYLSKKSIPIHSPHNKVFVKYQAQGGILTPPLAYALELFGNGGI